LSQTLKKNYAGMSFDAFHEQVTLHTGVLLLQRR